MSKPEEGTLLPETYAYVWGDKRQDIIAQMQRQMTDFLNGIWKSRPENSYIQTLQQLVILASLVEKETGIAAERAHIAGVFINRLKKGMMLQSDPTVVYGITGGEKNLDRPLELKDLKHISPYNTYVISGLPPQPIACPGRPALLAALNPALTDDYYFVADGTGGHAFSPTYGGHVEKVKKWRMINKRIGKTSKVKSLKIPPDTLVK